MILQQNQWDVERAIRNFEGSSKKKKFKLLSWNIDGLDEQENTLAVRTRGVIEVIKREEPDAIFLQEVVPPSFELLRENLPEYEIHSGDTQSYFVVILTRRDRFHVDQCEILPFINSKMNRNLLILHTTFDESVKVDLLTSHHESGTEDAASAARVEQLRLSFEQMANAPDDRVVFFGGDLNLREKELKKLGPLPSNIVDLWVATGERKECAYTWDMNRNTNSFYPSTGYRPRARFDRLYFRASDGDVEFEPVHFELEGLEKLYPGYKKQTVDGRKR